MKYLIFFFCIIPILNGWSYSLKNLWSTGSFKKICIPENGKIQFLSLKKMAKHLIYYHDGKVTFKSNKIYQTINKKNVVDVDVEYWNNTLYTMISYYDVKKNLYKTETTDCLTFESKSPINRCFIYEYNSDVLLGLIVTNGGEILKINKTYNNTSYKLVALPFFVYISEYYIPYLYIVDSYNVMHVFCPKKEKVICTLDLNYSSPIVHFFVHTTLKQHEYHITVGLHDKRIYSFFIYKGKIESNRQLSVTVKSQIKKIHCDDNKAMVILDNGSLICFDMLTGDLWFELKNVCDTNYVSRLYSSRQTFIMDGTDGLVFYNVEGKEKSDSDIDDLNNFKKWITIDKQPSSPFLSALMKAPLFDISHNQGNWSWPLGESNDTSTE
jgi:hypothetical protein